ncbi:hypothetical protein N2603_16235 [Bradyrhizobium huanghuaihaiense]|uniref:hypothetical protein n=1 Tax=Bradyrhizobium huanghuaihaiense TaxID=990078 RepID=UPI0021A97C8B|nr:hypothetical protein [Bradyrhizobium sp. CB3035]UWU79958.1 hypothetical protein N2603_16235 [Bradyrhizobium sp. CB3035]
MTIRITSARLAMLLTSTVLDGANAQSVGTTYSSTAPKSCRQVGKPGELATMR